MPKGLGAPFRGLCGEKGRENFFLAKKPRNPLKRLDSDEKIQGNPRKSNGHNWGSSQQNGRSPRKPKRTEIYSDAVLAFVSLRWRLKSLIEANWNVPALVSASIEPSEKIL